MSEQSAIAPDTLSLGYWARVTEHVTNLQYTKLERNLDLEGITGFLARAAGSAAIGPWDAYNAIADEITSAHAELGPKEAPDQLAVTIKFDSARGRNDFQEFGHYLLAGIHGVGATPIFESKKSKELRIQDFTYADVCTFGRTAETYMRAQYRKQGPNLRHIMQRTVNHIDKSGVRNYLPQDLSDRIDYHRWALGKAAGESLLTSGHIGIIGGTMRQALEEAEIPIARIQRKRRNRPAVEEGVYFSLNNSGTIPLSTTTLRQALAEQGRDRIEEVVASFHKRDWTKLVGDAWDALSSFATTQGGVVLVRAIATTVAATIPAAFGQYSDARLRKRLPAQTS